MRKLILTGLMLSVLILGGCIFKTTPSSFFITMDQGDTLEFSVEVFPATDEVLWKLKDIGGGEDTAYGNRYTFTPVKTGFYELTVNDIMGPDGYGYYKTWYITVQ